MLPWVIAEIIASFNTDEGIDICMLISIERTKKLIHKKEFNTMYEHACRKGKLRIIKWKLATFNDIFDKSFVSSFDDKYPWEQLYHRRWFCNKSKVAADLLQNFTPDFNYKNYSFRYSNNIYFIIYNACARDHNDVVKYMVETYEYSCIDFLHITILVCCKQNNLKLAKYLMGVFKLDYLTANKRLR